MYQFCCTYIVEILVIQVEWSMKVILAYSLIDSSLMSLFATDFNTLYVPIVLSLSCL